jgi:hypothetical protein
MRESEKVFDIRCSLDVSIVFREWRRSQHPFESRYIFRSIQEKRFVQDRKRFRVNEVVDDIEIRQGHEGISPSKELCDNTIYVERKDG